MRYLTLFACLATVSPIAACGPMDSKAPADATSNEQDQFIHERMSQNAMETGHASSWRSSTGNYGSITPNKPYRNENDSYCRDFTQSITVDAILHTGIGTACRENNGVWKIVG